MVGELSICEGISGTWFYHLSEDAGKTALCGARVMPTQIPLRTWGMVGHLHERYCSQCAQLRSLTEDSNGR
jgi:hypothetical protein